MEVTPRVRVGAVLTLVGREVQGLVAAVPLHGHAALVFSTDLTPERAAALGALVGAPVHVVLPAAPADPPAPNSTDDGAAGGGGDDVPDRDADGRVPHLAFAGVVRRVQVVARPQGGDRLVVEAAGASYMLGERRTQQRFASHTALDVARALDVRVDASASAGPALDPLHLVQVGESEWDFVARVAADAGLVLRPAWPRTADGTGSGDATEPPPPTLPPDAEVELARGFRDGADACHRLTYGRELLACAGSVGAVNPGVDGAHYHVEGSHAHAFRDVRQTPTWLAGGRPFVQAAAMHATGDANGGAPGLVPAAVRAPTPALFRAALRRASERRFGNAVRVTGRSTVAALRAGDRIALQSGSGVAWTLSDTLVGEYGVLAVVHRWDGQLYQNGFVATPWAGWHPEPADVPHAAPLLSAAWEALGAGTDDVNGGAPAVVASGGLGALGLGHGSGANGADLARAAAGGAATPAGGQPLTFGLVVDDADPSGQARVRVRYAWQAPNAPPSACAWARVASVVAGRGRGLGALPQPGDEVLVAFADGHPERPVVVGALWSGRDQAAHRPGLQHWVTAAGNTLRFVEGAAAGGEGRERVEIYTPEGKAWIQLAAQGPGGVPLVTIRSAGDLHLEAPDGALRVHAKGYEAHVAGNHRSEVGGAHTVHATGAVTLASGAALGLAAAGRLAATAGGTLALHGTAGHHVTGARVAHHPSGGSAPNVGAPRVAPRASAWARPPVPPAGRLTHTGDKPAPRIKPKAAGPAPQRVKRQGPGSTAAPKSVAKPPLDCGAAWAKVMGETDRVLAAGTAPGTNPKGEDPKLVRNRAISAEYARLYRANPGQMRWAGLASVVSTQGGCAMRDAGTAVARSGAAVASARAVDDMVGEAERAVLGTGVGGTKEIVAAAEHLHRLTTGTQRALYDTNEEIFKDIYPAMRMYNDHGLAGVQGGPGGCGDQRPNPDPAERGIPGSEIGVAPQLQAALGLIDGGNVPLGSHDIAKYEQSVIVQGRIWNRNHDAAEALSLNQTFTQADAQVTAVAERVPLIGGQIASKVRAVGAVAREGMYHAMRARRTSFALTTDCLPPDSPGEVLFHGDFRQPEPRVNYYDDLIDEYVKMQADGRADSMVPTIVGRDPAPPSAVSFPLPHSA